MAEPEPLIGQHRPLQPLRSSLPDMCQWILPRKLKDVKVERR